MGNTQILSNLRIYTYKPEGNTRDAEYSSYPKFEFVFLFCHNSKCWYIILQLDDVWPKSQQQPAYNHRALYPLPPSYFL